MKVGDEVGVGYKLDSFAFKRVSGKNSRGGALGLATPFGGLGDSQFDARSSFVFDERRHYLSK